MAEISVPRENATSALTGLGNRWAFLGDSLMLGGWSGTTHEDTWPTYAALWSRGKIQVVLNAGGDGDTSAEALARLSTVTATDAQVCAVGVGTNDIGGGVSLSTYQANVAGIVSGLRSAGITPVLCTMPPNEVSAARIAATSMWNQWLRRYAAAQHIPLLDFYTLLVDPSDGGFASGMGSGDSIHPGAAGYAAMGRYAADTLDPILQPAVLPLGTDPGDTNNLIPQPTFWTDGGSGVATTWVAIRNGTGTRTPSLVAPAADEDVLGKWQQIVASAWTAEAGVGYYTNTNLAAKITAGDRLAIACLLSVPALTAGTKIFVEMRFGVSNFLMLNGITQPLDGVCAFYDEVTVPAGFTNYEFDAYLLDSGGATGGTLKVAQVGVFNLTKLGIV